MIKFQPYLIRWILAYTIAIAAPTQVLASSDKAQPPSGDTASSATAAPGAVAAAESDRCVTSLRATDPISDAWNAMSDAEQFQNLLVMIGYTGEPLMKNKDILRFRDMELALPYVDNAKDKDGHELPGPIQIQHLLVLKYEMNGSPAFMSSPKFYLTKITSINENNGTETEVAKKNLLDSLGNLTKDVYENPIIADLVASGFAFPSQIKGKLFQDLMDSATWIEHLKSAELITANSSTRVKLLHARALYRSTRMFVAGRLARFVVKSFFTAMIIWSLSGYQTVVPYVHISHHTLAAVVIKEHKGHSHADKSSMKDLAKTALHNLSDSGIPHRERDALKADLNNSQQELTLPTQDSQVRPHIFDGPTAGTYWMYTPADQKFYLFIDGFESIREQAGAIHDVHAFVEVKKGEEPVLYAQLMARVNAVTVGQGQVPGQAPGH